MVKNICQFNLAPGVEPERFWARQLARHADRTMEVGGRHLAGYVVNQAMSPLDGEIPFAITVELWFHSADDRDEFLAILAGTDDGFDDEVVDFCAYTVDEAVIRAPARLVADPTD